jgi:hypothetical protein
VGDLIGDVRWRAFRAGLWSWPVAASLLVGVDAGWCEPAPGLLAAGVLIGFGLLLSLPEALSGFRWPGRLACHWGWHDARRLPDSASGGYLFRLRCTRCGRRWEARIPPPPTRPHGRACTCTAENSRALSQVL